MIYTQEIINTIKETINSGYYERLAPMKRKKKSLSDAIEDAKSAGYLPIIAEVSTAWPSHGLLLPTKSSSSRLINELSISGINAISTWIEPRFHAGDLRWLNKDLNIPIISRDWIIDQKQIVGADAIILNLSLLQAANVELNPLIDYAHDQDLEVILEVVSTSQFSDAKSTEADIFLINNQGPNGSGPQLSITTQTLSKIKTGRLVISSQGVNSSQDLHSILIAGADAVELSAPQSASPQIFENITSLKRALYGKDPNIGSAQQAEVNEN